MIASFSMVLSAGRVMPRTVGFVRAVSIRTGARSGSSAHPRMKLVSRTRLGRPGAASGRNDRWSLMAARAMCATVKRFYIVDERARTCLRQMRHADGLVRPLALDAGGAEGIGGLLTPPTP